MTTILNVEEMRQSEKNTMANLQVTEHDLIEIAGSALFHHFQKEVCPDNRKRLLIIAGPGNNGSDALVFANKAIEAGYPVQIGMIGEVKKHKELRTLKERKLAYDNLIQIESSKQLEELIDKSDVLIDGLFGIGIDRPITGLYRDVIDLVNQKDKYVFAIDIPSGINGETGMVMREAIKADWTAVVGCLKSGNLLNDALDYSGVIRIVDIGLVLCEQKQKRKLVGYDDVLPLFESRKHKSHKYDYGNILVIGGSPGMMGASQFAGYAALKSGAGVVTIAVKKEEIAVWNQLFPELMFAFYDRFEQLEALLARIDFCIFGPGMRPGNASDQEFLRLLINRNIPVLVDAGGLDHFMEILAENNHHDSVIITPHVGEMARMLDIPTEEIQISPERYLDFFTQKGIVTLLKGHVTIIRSAEETIYLKAGNPGMASAGMGDVLSGMIAAMATQGHPLFEAAKRGALLHAKSAEIALTGSDETSLVASDLLRVVGQAVTALKKR